jgi:GNAT superfamily N-acetyltransferase
VPDRGGLRVDTQSDEERVRWIFSDISPGIQDLARSIDEPGCLLKLCGGRDDLQAILPPRWTVHAPAFFMQAVEQVCAQPFTGEYHVEAKRTGSVSQARIYCDAGEIVASGYAAETGEAFIYDRIFTAPEHRRRGLGRALMTSLRAFRQHLNRPELLVATGEGRALYSSLGWDTISPYSTASVSVSRRRAPA